MDVYHLSLDVVEQICDDDMIKILDYLRQPNMQASLRNRRNSKSCGTATAMDGIIVKQFFSKHNAPKHTNRDALCSSS